MESKKNFQSITLYKDMAPQVLELTKEEAGEIYQAIFRFSCYGEDTDFSQCDRFVRSLWETTKLKLKAGEEHSAYISEVRAEAGRKGGQAKGSKCKEMQANEAEVSKCTTYTNTETGTNSSTHTISSTVTKQEQATAVSDSVDRQAASAAAKAEPPIGDLFSVKQLNAVAHRNKVDLTEDGIQAFHEEMQDSRWILYQKPIEKKGITRALRAWAKFHPEYNQAKESCNSGDSINERGSDAIEKEIYTIARKYISQRLFNENVGGHHCLIQNYCPKEAFTNEQLEYMHEIWSIWPKQKKYVKEDLYL